MIKGKTGQVGSWTPLHRLCACLRSFLKTTTKKSALIYWAQWTTLNHTAVSPLSIRQHITETGLTLKATGNVLLHRQWEGRTEQRKFGLSVRTSSAGWSAMISAMLRFSWGRSLGTAAAASGCPAGELTSFIFPGTGWRLLDGGLNLRVALGSTGIRITTAWIIKQGTKGSPAPLLLSASHTVWEKLGSVRRCSLNFSASANGKWDCAHSLSKPSALQTLAGAF